MAGLQLHRWDALTLMLYCVCAASDLRRAASPPPTAPAGLRWVEAGSLAALVAPAPAHEDVAAMLAFGEVVAHYHARLDVVPMRWGSRLADTAAVTAHLRAEAERYRCVLAALADCVEMGVRLPLPEPPAGTAAGAAGPGATASGRDYLLRRRAQLQAATAAETALERLDADLAGLYRDTRREQGWFAGGRRLSAHYLVPRPRLAAFRQRLAAAVAAGRLTTAAGAPLTSGPWPPHSFAGGTDGTDADTATPDTRPQDTASAAARSPDTSPPDPPPQIRPPSDASAPDTSPPDTSAPETSPSETCVPDTSPTDTDTTQ